MSFGPSGSHRIELGTTIRVDPRVVLGSQILQMGYQELEQTIEAELNENPALERAESERDPITEEAILKVVAPNELRPESSDNEFRRSLPSDDAETSWIELAAGTPLLGDHLRAQLLPSLPTRLRELGDYVVGCVNEHGYLTVPNEEIALDSGSNLDDVVKVVAALHSCEPRGVGARSVRECLLLQLDGDKTIETKLARAIVKSYLDDFINRRTSRICRRYGVLPPVVERAFDAILSLAPYPAENFGSTPGVGSRSVAVVADIAISRDEEGWHVAVSGPDPDSLSIDRAYSKRYSELEKMERAPKDEKRHVGVFVERANSFIHCIRQRRLTMKRIGEYLIKRQTGFLSTGQYHFLQPLTKSKMAVELELHESTISRATQGKFVAIPTGEMVAFEVFFKPALRVQKIIEEILQTENPGNPLSDQAIAEMLAERGIVVARRTVNKYRDRKKLLSSRKRRTA